MSRPTQRQHAAARLILANVFAHMENINAPPEAFFDGFTEDGDVRVDGETVRVADAIVAATTLLRRAYAHADDPSNAIRSDMTNVALTKPRENYR